MTVPAAPASTGLVCRVRRYTGKMTFNDDLSALVVLRTPQKNEDTPPAAGGLAPPLPSSESIETARNFFRSRGFAVSPAFGISFSITGNTESYEATFGHQVRTPSDDPAGNLELPRDLLPPEILEVIDTVAFPGAPDFGPRDY
jgi:hypothetical protein